MIDLEQRGPEKKNFENRLALIYIFFVFLFSAIIFQTYSLQVSSFIDYEEASNQNKTREVLVQPLRGIIFDRNGKIIANNIPSYDLVILPGKISDLNGLLDKLKEFLVLTESELLYINENFKKKAAYNRELTIKKNLTNNEIAAFEVRSFDLDNISIEKRYSRQSNYPEIFSHALGYVGGVNDLELANILSSQNLQPIETEFTYSNGFIKGMTGIENIYDKDLRGLFGKRIYEVDAKGKFLKELGFEKPKNGKNLYSNLDIEAQQVAFKEMKKRRGAVVAVEIESGSIVTYLSSPSFSINELSNNISSKEFNALLKDSNKPFFDRASQGRYSPASTIKPAIGLYGIEKNLISWNTTIEDPGYFILPEDQRVYRGWKEGGHGRINLSDAIIQSSNTFFFLLAYQSDIYDLKNHLNNFGFGKKVCNDCFNQDIALLPDPEWKMNNLNFGWFKGDTVNMGVGQGYLSATPIQLAYYANIVAQKGLIKNLSFIKDNNEPHADILLQNISDADWKRMHESMIGVIENPKGTAKRLKNLKTYSIGAKSGTVELVSLDSKEEYKIVRQEEGKRDHAIIIAFGPMPNPKYAVSVVIENGESGGSVAGPVAVNVLNELINNEET